MQIKPLIWPYLFPPSFVNGHREFSLVLVRPAGGDGFEAGVEADALHAVHMHIAEEGAFPAAEAMEGHGHGDGHVDADHADFDLMRKLPRRAAVAGENGNAISKRMERREWALHGGFHEKRALGNGF